MDDKEQGTRELEMNQAFDRQIAARSQAANDFRYQNIDAGQTLGYAGTQLTSGGPAVDMDWQNRREAERAVERATYLVQADQQLRCQALDAALKTDNPSRDELVKTAETLYAFLKGPSA